MLFIHDWQLVLMFKTNKNVQSQKKHWSLSDSVTETFLVALEEHSPEAHTFIPFRTSRGIVTNAITADKLSSFYCIDRRWQRASVSFTQRNRRSQTEEVSKACKTPARPPCGSVSINSSLGCRTYPYPPHFLHSPRSAPSLHHRHHHGQQLGAAINTFTC